MNRGLRGLRGLRAVLVLLAVPIGWALLLVLPAAASELTLAPSPAACLSPSAAQRGTPDYPDDLWTSGTAGRVQVELVFTGSDLQPEMKILRSEGGPEFVQSVRRHVRDLRLPCLESADIPMRLQFDFVFEPVERKGTAPEGIDPDRAEQERQLACVLNAAGLKPDYPMQARSNNVQGRVLVEMRFVNADGPPEITLVTRPASKDLLPPVTQWAQQFRMPCHAGRPVQTRWTLVYRFEGDGRYGFKKLRLVDFLGSIRGIENQRVDFDFNTMGCPFEIRLQYLQPQRRNDVVQINEPNRMRQPFLDWLAGAELKIGEKNQDAVFGDKVVLTVPCGKFDTQQRGSSSPPTSSTPQEKS